MFESDFEKEIKHKKKCDNKSKSWRKSNHKHDYHPCEIIIMEPSFPRGFSHNYGLYCVICGKIGERKWIYQKEEIDVWHTQNPNAPKFVLQDFGQKYIIDF